MGSCCYWAGVKRMMAPLCPGHMDIWHLEFPVGLMGIARLSGRERPMAMEEPGVLGIDIIVTEGWNLDACHRAGYMTTPECMQEAGPKAPGIGSAAVAAADESDRRAAPS